MTTEPQDQAVAPRSGDADSESPETSARSAMLQRRRSTNRKILAVFGVLVASMLLLVGCVAVLGSVVASKEPEVRPTAATEPAATTTATQTPSPSELTSPEPDTAPQVQAKIDALGGWGHWSDVVTGLSSIGSMVTVETALWNKPSNESDARFLCSFTATSSTDMPNVSFRVAASDGVSLATCQVP